MKNTNLQKLLSLAQENEFCLENDKGEFISIAPNSAGKVIKIVEVIAKELFGSWPLNEEQERSFKILTTLRYKPQRNSLKSSSEA